MSWNFIAKHTPTVPGLASIVPPLRRALIHWVTWNRMIEEFADFRYRMEGPVHLCGRLPMCLEYLRCETHLVTNSCSRERPCVDTSVDYICREAGFADDKCFK